MRGVYYSACSLCYKTIGVTKNIRLLLRDGLLFMRLLLPESTVVCKLDGQFLNEGNRMMKYAYYVQYDDFI